MKCFRSSFILVLLNILCSKYLLAQQPFLKQWDYRYGWTSGDYLSYLNQAKDGGIILGGYSDSGIGGDKTQATFGSWDYWILKLDALGNRQFDSDVGGTDTDVLSSMQQTSDGGYILGGYSESGVGGDKTEPLRGGSGDLDYWIVKLDSAGIKQWDKDFGGTAFDFLYSIQQTSDGGYILGGTSHSGVGGDKTEASRDTATNYNGDYWILKLDAQGNKQWDKTFGGFSREDLCAIQQTTDGGYILGGRSESDINGDKTQPRWGGYGDSDYWIVKTDSMGNMQWDKDFGGLNWEILCALRQTSDNGYILMGSSFSGISGDKTQPSWGYFDYWIVKTDAFGIKQWDKDLGGNGDDEAVGNIFFTPDGGYLFSGTSYSSISGDKTEDNLGSEQSWIVKTDSLCNKQWDKTLHTNTGWEDDEQGLAIQLSDGCYIMANSTIARIGGDKTQDNWDTTFFSPDYWVIKFCDSTFNANFISSRHLCSGSCTDFTNLSTNANTYQWYFPGAIPDTSTVTNPTGICYANPGIYDVQLIANNGTGYDTLFLANYITVYPPPPAQSITQHGDTLFAIAGAGAYQWFYNTNIIVGATNYFHIAQASGNYNVVCTDPNGCEVEAAAFNVIAGVSDYNKNFAIYISYSANKINLNFYANGNAHTQVQLLDITGKVQLQMSLEVAEGFNKYQLHVGEISAGVYLVRLLSDEGGVTKKLIIE